MKRLIIAIFVIFSFLPAFVVNAQGQADCNFNGSPIYARVRPLPRDSHAFSIYIPDWPKSAPYTYPATIFVQYILNPNSWTHDTMYVNLNAAWMAAMAKANGTAWNYLHNASDGTFFNGSKLGVDTFPGNPLLVIQRKYRAGECWDEIQAYTYTSAPPDIANLPAYELGLQTGQKYSEKDIVHAAPVNSGNVMVPLITKPGVGVWIEDLYLELFPALPTRIAVQVDGLNVRTQPDPTSSIVEVAVKDTPLILTFYAPLQRRTFGYVTDVITGKAGWVSLEYWPHGLLRTTDWQMDSLPVPPG